MRKYVLKIVILIILFIGINISIKNSNNIDKLEFSTSKETQKLKVLVIEINPYLNSITNKELYPNNNGHPKVSEFLDQDSNKALEEMIEDFEDTSYNYLDIEYTYEYLDEFPTYKTDITLLNGTKSKRLDEETYLSLTGNTNDKGNWYDMIYNDYLNTIQSYDFDYEYIIDKFNLVERRNNKEFDQVWLLTIDPSSTYETAMVGSNPFWINGVEIKKDCDNFLFGNISISRRDANLHAYGHGMEGVLSKVFSPSYDSYNKEQIDVSTEEKFNKLNYYEKFTLTDYNSIGDISGVGNIHYPFNGTFDYDYSNTTFVKSNWETWLDYPNVKYEFKEYNNKAWLEYNLNKKILADSNENQDSDRLYSRFWLSLIPHIEGYTSDGYYNNWWKYFYSLDYITKIEDDTIDREFIEGDKISINLKTTTLLNKTNIINEISKDNNIVIEDENVLSYKDNILYANNVGTSKVSVSYDGHTISYNITVKENPNKEENNSIKSNTTEEKIINNPNTGNSIPIINLTILIISFRDFSKIKVNILKLIWSNYNTPFF